MGALCPPEKESCSCLLGLLRFPQFHSGSGARFRPGWFGFDSFSWWSPAPIPSRFLNGR